MFKELFELAKTAVLTLTISADEKSGQMIVNVIPKPKKDLAEPALTKELSLTATPEEFNADFVKALFNYRVSRKTLQEQAEVTQEVLEAAKSTSAKKAADTVIKASKQQAKDSSKKMPTHVETEDDKSANESVTENHQPELFA